MKAKKSIITLILFFIIVIGVFVWYKIKFKPVKYKKAKVEFTAESFYNEIETYYLQGNLAEEKKYLDKVIRVEGVVTSVDALSNHLVLNNYTFCSFNLSSDLKSINIEDNIIIKGKYVGYSSLFKQLNLNECTLVE